jgi:hypothetical protein
VSSDKGLPAVTFALSGSELVGGRRRNAAHARAERQGLSFQDRGIEDERDVLGVQDLLEAWLAINPPIEEWQLAVC